MRNRDLGVGDIARRSFSVVVTANTRLSVAGTYRFTRDNDIDFRLTYIGSDLDELDAPEFDAEVLQRLYEYGVFRGRAGAFYDAPPLARPD